MQNDFDKVLIVKRPLEDRINAVIERDKTTKEKVLDRIKNQIDYENLKNDNHIIISNDASLENLKASVKAVIEKIIEEKN
jgi:dephospho-CoA kinase